jgi:Gpi18-like mannosyltransferase
MNTTDHLRDIVTTPAVRRALILFLAVRVFLSVWAVVTLTLNPLPAEPDEMLRPYLGEVPLTEGIAGLLLGPWQRFDTLRYLRIARQGYAAVEDSVFPPLYPLAMRGLGAFLAHGLLPRVDHSQTIAASYLLAGLILSNLACLGSLILLYVIAKTVADGVSATRVLVYTVLFPTGFFLFGAYTEPVFLLLVLGSIWAARRGRPWIAGALGGLASLTRLVGWVLVVPLSYEYLRRRDFDLHRLNWAAIASLLPPWGLVCFLGWRWWAGLPSISQVFADYWLYRTRWPGADLVTTVQSIVAGQATFVLVFNLVCAGLLIAASVMVWHRLPRIYGLYMISLLLVTLMTSVEQRPLNSLSRYTLVFFPTFVLLGLLGHRAWINRLILYPSLALLLYFSGQFFIWGWVA